MGANQSAEMMAEANHRLSQNMMEKLTEGEAGKNICISPLSLACALSMLLRGARGDTASEIIEVLCLRGISEADLKSCCEHFLSSLEKSNNAYTLECANAAVLQQKFAVKDDYKQILENTFHAEFIQEDFTKHTLAVVDRINKWVENKTHGVIDRLIDSLDPLTVMVLLNAVYFKGKWKKQFPENGTRLQKFYNKGIEDNAKEVDMMHLTGEFDYAELETFKVLQLPYRGNDIAMLIMLPNSLNGLDEMEKSLTPDFVRKFKGEMRNRKVNLSLPKFRVEYLKSLKETLSQLGMRKPFVDGADLSGICDVSDLIVSDIVHKAVVEVNEEGTVAAAATAVMIQCRMLVMELEFNVDHPFLFTIYDIRNNINLFVGRIVEL